MRGRGLAVAARLAMVSATCGALAGQLLAQSPDSSSGRNRRIDLSVDQHQVSHGLGDWHSAELRLVIPQAAGRTVWYGDALWRQAFHDEGVYASVAVQQVLSRDWFVFVSLGGGSGDFLFPDLRADASLSYKWLASQRLVTTVGGTMVDAKRGYREESVFAAFDAYPVAGMVLEAGVRGSRTSPGGVDSQRTFGALTLGSEGTRYVTFRGSTGTEGYQLLGPSTVIAKFTSHEGAVGWREWLGRTWGALAQGEYYTNPSYRRTGVTIGVFAHW